MLYQREFQNNEEPAKHHISCFGYETEADRQYPTAIRLSMGRDTRWSLVASFCFLHFVCTVITTLRSARIW